ncbi:hypothetical protein Tco_1009814, partial [Tanacetum coccineum]
QMTMDDLLQVVPQLMTRIDSLEKDLKQTKLTMGSAIVKLVKKVKKLKDEDWDLIRAKIEANAELLKSMLGTDLQGEDFAKKMVELGTWKLSQLKNLSFEEVKEEFDKLVKQKTERGGNIAMKRLPFDKTNEDESEVSKDVDPILGTNIPVNPVPVAIKPPNIATYKDIEARKEGQQSIIRWRYYKYLRVHLLKLETSDIYMLTERRKYPLTAKVAKGMTSSPEQTAIVTMTCTFPGGQRTELLQSNWLTGKETSKSI